MGYGGRGWYWVVGTADGDMLPRCSRPRHAVRVHAPRRYYVHLKRPSELQKDMNMYIFRTGYTPMWEVSSVGVPQLQDLPWAAACTRV